MPLLISNNQVVYMHYKLTDDEGNLLGSTDGSEPLAYLNGAGNIVAGLEKELEGKAEGDSLQVRIEPEEGYGEVVPDLVQTVERAAFQGVDSVEEGMMFEAQAPSGSTQRIIVKKVDGDKVTVDANHPLAGVALNFDVQIVDVREATQEEVAHGHVH